MSTKVRPISGFPEYLPDERLIEAHMLDVIARTFELHGFVNIETRAVEPVERLLGKGGDADKEIYGVRRLAADANDAEESDPSKALALHFDLTVPFSRYVLENAGKLTFPFRRYQIQKVWRGERPQDGRFREFVQADIDVVGVGELPFHYEAEMPLVIADAFSRLPIGPFRIQVNNRRIPEGFYLGLGLSEDMIIPVLRIVDKIDKVGPQAVCEMLVEAGLTAEQADKCLALAQISSTDTSFADQVRALGVEHPTLETGLSELSAVVEAAHAAAPGLLYADLSVARGLDYYTGTVYETQLIGHESYGSICSGGRYDSLVSDGKTTYPGVGISIGVTRLLAKLLSENSVQVTRPTPTCVLVALNHDDDRPRATAVANALRSRGIACEIAPSAAKFGKQIRYADRRGVPFVWFLGATDEAGATVADSVKDIRSGQQVDADSAVWMPPTEDLRPRVLAADGRG